MKILISAIVSALILPATLEARTWVTIADEMVKAGQRDKIKPFDSALTEKAIHVASTNYYLDTN